MDADQHLEAASEAIVARARARFAKHLDRTRVQVDRLFAKILVGEWVFAIVLALTFSPYGWQGKTKAVHLHVWTALVLGGAICSLPVALALLKPGRAVTRHVITFSQMLFSALLIHLTGGRIETHFHVFGSLAIVAFYLDWTVLVTATLTVALDHLLRGILWPESVYGIVNPEWWRFLEHAFWVGFAVSFLMASCQRQVREWLGFAEEGGMIEALAESEWRQRSVLERGAEGTPPRAAE